MDRMYSILVVALLVLETSCKKTKFLQFGHCSICDIALCATASVPSIYSCHCQRSFNDRVQPDTLLALNLPTMSAPEISSSCIELCLNPCGRIGHTDSVEAVAFSSIQPVAATASMDGRLLVWDNSTLGIRSTCQHGEVRPWHNTLCMVCALTLFRMV